jgi:cysteinyl-tRNA synthetase
VNYLQNFKTLNGKSNLKTKKLIAKLKNNFEENMNNDMHVKNALDILFTNVSKLVSLTERGKISIKEAEKAVAQLKSIDQVLQVIF